MNALRLKNSARLIVSIVTLAVILLGCSPQATSTPTSAPQAEPAATTVPAKVDPTATSAPAATVTSAPTAAPTATAAQVANTPKDTIIYAGNISDITTLDPATMYSWGGILTVNNLYQTLVRFEGADYTALKPGLADKWEIKDNSNGSEITFTLKEGQKFATGNPITADDVVYSFQRVIKLKKGPSFLFTDIAGLTADSIKAADAKTVVITLPKSYSPQIFLSVLTFTVGGVVDSKEVKSHEVKDDLGEAWLVDHSAGSGTYVLDHWTKEVEVLLKANPNYGGVKPLVPNVLIQHVIESTNQQLSLEKGDIDIARNLSPEQIAALKDKPGVTTAKGNSLLLVYVGLNQKTKELADEKVREALRTAVDYDGIINGLLSGNALKVQTLIPNGLLGYNSDAPFQQDTAKAKQLLADAGYGSGLKLELLAPTGNAPGGAAWADIAAKLQADYAQAGITITIKQVPYSELYAAYRAGNFQLITVEWGPDYNDPDGNVRPFADFSAKSIGSRLSWNDPAISKKAEDATLIADPAQRAAAYKEITDYVLHKGPYVVLYQPTEQFGLNAGLKGFVWKPAGWIDFSLLSK